MEDEPHEVVKLLLARMESHPEEFRLGEQPFRDRWYDHVNSIQIFGNEADKAAIAEGLRKIRLAETHERVMDELLNGEDRRRKEEEDREFERHLAHAAMQQQQQQKAYVNQIQGMVGQVYGGGGGAGAGIVGKSYSSVLVGDIDSDLDRYRNTPTGHLPVANGGTDSTIINQIKNMLKKGK